MTPCCSLKSVLLKRSWSSLIDLGQFQILCERRHQGSHCQGCRLVKEFQLNRWIIRRSERKVNRVRLHDFEAWRILVPLNRTAFLWAPSTPRFSEGSKSWIDSFSKGVDSPESIASFTIQVPLTRSMSAGTVVSVLRRARMKMRGRKKRKQFLDIHTNRNYISRK